MSKAKTIYMANPKSYLSFSQTNDWLTESNKLLQQCAAKHTIIMCPSFTSLDYAHQILASTTIAWGAQDCSMHEQGAYTGQITARTLAELGCRYCLVGHSETRYCTNSQEIGEKIVRLLAHQITPIVCISSATSQELAPIKQALAKNGSQQLLIAYEPLNAIGSGNAIAPVDLQETIRLIKKELTNYQQNVHYRILYGGSVTAAIVKPLKAIADLDGFLVGKACTQIAEFRAIIDA